MSGMTHTRLKCQVSVAAALLLVSGCGNHTKIEHIPVEAVPHDLLNTSRPTIPVTAEPSPTGVPARVFFFDAKGNKLTSRAADIAKSDTRTMLTQLLEVLSAGPTSDQSQRELRTLLPTSSTFSVNSVETPLVSISFEPAVEPAPDTLHMLIGQIVMTVCSLPQVEEVKLSLADGEEFSAPLPDSSRITGPLRRSHYSMLLNTAPPNDSFETAAPGQATGTTASGRVRRRKDDAPNTPGQPNDPDPDTPNDPVDAPPPGGVAPPKETPATNALDTPTEAADHAERDGGGHGTGAANDQDVLEDNAGSSTSATRTRSGPAPTSGRPVWTNTVEDALPQGGSTPPHVAN